MAIVGSLIANLGMDTARFEAGIKRSKRSLSKFASSAKRQFNEMNIAAGRFATGLGFAAGAGFAALTKNALDTADQMQKLSVRLGVSTEALSQMKFAAEQSGIGFNTLTMAMQRQQRRIAEAAQGTGEAKDALIELGLSAQALNQIPVDKQLLAIADAMGGVKDSGDKTRLAMKLFDSEGVALLQMLDNGSIGIKEFMQEADRLGLTLNNKTAVGAAAANDAINRAKSAMQGAALQSLENTAPAIEHLANTFAKAIPQGVNFAIDGFLHFQRVSADLLAGLVEKYSAAQFAIADILSRFGFSNTVTTRMAEESAAYAASIRKIGESAKAVLGDVDRLESGVSELAKNPPVETTAEIERMTEGVLRAREEAQKLGETLSVDLFDNTKSAFDQIVDQWKKTLMNMVNEWISSGIRDLFGSIFNSGSSGGFLSSLGSLFGFDGKASGGPVTAGRPYIVGEKGPELFTPSTSGNIIPNHQMGGSSVVFNQSYDFRGSTVSEAEVRQIVAQSNEIVKRDIQQKMQRGRF